MAQAGVWRDDPAVEQRLQDAVSTERLMETTRTIAQWVRLSGSEEERQSFDYLERLCREIGAEVQRFAPECYISLPGPATLTVLSPESRQVECITHSFSAATQGLEGEVVWAGAGSPADFQQANARGKIALTDGLSTPNKIMTAQAAGAAAVISINDENFHEMIVTPVWGAPVPETAHLVPAIPVVSVKAPDGEALRGMLNRGLRVRITTQVDTGWRPIPCMTAEIKGDEPRGRFVMFSGHVDSWHHGAMDNGSANATMVETLRVLAKRPGGLRRGLRLAFWSGHSHGRYAASTWYADSHWRELNERCVAHVNVDSTGAVGASTLEDANTMAEATALAADAVHEVTGQTLEYRRFGRAGDQSFWGPGLPSFFMSLSHQGEPSAVTAGLQAVIGGNVGRSGGLGWWWHTIHDTMDKIDPANLTRDTKVYVLVCNRLCNAPVLPLKYAPVAEEIRDAVRGYAERAGGAADLSAAVAAAERLAAAAQRLDAATAAAASSTDATRAERLNACMMKLGRLLVPISYSEVSPYEHDLAISMPPVPLLRGANDLANLNPNSDAHRFLRTKLLRAQNRVSHALDQATEAIEQTLGAVPAGRP